MYTVPDNPSPAQVLEVLDLCALNKRILYWSGTSHLDGTRDMHPYTVIQVKFADQLTDDEIAFNAGLI